MKKKILLIGSKEFFSLEKMYLRAFKSLNYDTKIYHAFNIRKNLISRFSWKYLRFFYFIKYRKDLINFFKKNRIKYDLIIVFKGIFLNQRTILKCKSYTDRSIWANIFPDDPYNINYFRDISNHSTLDSLNSYDFFFTWSTKLVNKLKNKIAKQKIYYLPFGYDEYIHKGLKNTKKKFDISFVGTADNERYELLKKLNNFRVLIAGDGWKNKVFPENFVLLPKVNAKKFAKIIQLSRISLNLLRKQNFGSHNMKTFEIPAMNGLMLTPRSKEQNSFFPEGKTCFMFSTENELLKKIQFILSNKTISRTIQNAAKKKLKKNTYRNRVKNIIKVVNL